MSYTTLDRLTMALLNGDFSKAKEIVDLYIAGGSGQHWRRAYELITQAMRYIGTMWENNLITVADEHIASMTCKYLLHALFLEQEQQHRLPPLPAVQRAMFFCVENEQHDIGITIVAQLFKEKGWDTRLLGANLPLEYAVMHAKKWKPKVVGLSVTLPYHLSRVPAYTHALEQLPHRPIILVGGRAVQLYDISSLCSPSTLIIKDVDALQQLLAEWGDGGLCATNGL
ncbi:B12-binding domain-containing protein [Geobacillus sp. C56-T2]|uniref:cobalamin B12-binding domain-containing protein n=1 Tax=Geobacillus sp. C56-T2 TaxID=600773 RepID=UPI00155E87EC|nr:cobalamin B12-binding domain-containing protein [Geobacillus sp. C56-T2]